MEPKVLAITATSGRHTLMERSLRFFLNQDYNNKHLLIYQNSPSHQILDQDYPNIKIVNNYQYSISGAPYTNLGQIYNDALFYVPKDIDIICFCDDDDIFLPNHITEGVKGLLYCDKTAYKPERSYFRHANGVDLMGNTLEPSIFVKAKHVLKYGFKDTTTDQHWGWLQSLMDNNDIFVDPLGTPTLIYNWGDDIPTFKTSGDAGNPHNFDNYRNFSQDHGDNILTPWTNEQVQPYYQVPARPPKLYI